MVKISQNVDIIAKVYLVHLKVEHCQTLRVVSTFTGQKDSTVLTGKSILLFRVFKMTVKTSQKCACVHIWVNSQNRQLTGFDLYSYLPLMCSYSRRVNLLKPFFSNPDQSPSVWQNCPDDMITSTDHRRPTAMVTWTIPEVTDQFRSRFTIKSTTKPPVLLTVGVTEVKYNMIDERGLQAECTFNIDVIGKRGFLCYSL